MKTFRFAIAALALALALPALAVQDQDDSAKTWSCSLDDIGATLTLCKTGATDNQRLLITDIYAQSTTSTGGLFLLRFGTGTNCGTGTTSVFPSGATVPRLNYQPNTGLPSLFTFLTPVVVPTGKDLCVIGTATNTVTIHITGRVAP